jgi:hypothetical protein
MVARFYSMVTSLEGRVFAMARLAKVQPTKKDRPTKKELELLFGPSPTQFKEELRSFSRSGRFFSANYSRLIKEHPKEWVGIYDGKLRVTAKSLRSVVSQLEKKGFPPNLSLVEYMDVSGQKLIL